MLFEIVVQIPLLVMSEIAWWVRAAAALACLPVLFAIAAAVIAFCVRRTAERRTLAEDGHEGPLAPAYSQSRHSRSNGICSRLSSSYAARALGSPIICPPNASAKAAASRAVANATQKHPGIELKQP